MACSNNGSFCPPLPSLRIFAPGQINAESRDLQMLLVAAAASCHSDGTEHRAPTSAFPALSLPALLQESKKAAGLLNHYPGFCI